MRRLERGGKTMSKPGVVIAIASEKGGVGKSTLAASLAAHWHAVGYRVLAVDLDPQGTLQDWAAVAESNEISCPSVVGIADSVRSAVPPLAESHDVTLLDCPGRMGRRLAGALMIADFVLTPVPPGAPDAWALERVLEKIGEAQELRPDLRAAVVVNRAIRTRVARATIEALDGVEGVEHCPVRVGNRAAIAEAIAAGSGVTVAGSGSQAALEVRRLATWLELQVGLEPEEATHAA
ncbi:MAG TPA: ParA family protein [Sandaracinaceae bacterium LLY-WYZ-13_1]|nr:ParA family protein [Sandaracinaceae bacterium LLY-WYZ-13_1]